MSRTSRTPFPPAFVDDLPAPARDGHSSRQEALARLELELIPVRPAPYHRPGHPHVTAAGQREPVTAEQAAANRARLRAALDTPRGRAA
ncbi:hypothetical protein ABZ832_28595 [Streptantibioticus parmotrematis]|uniref:hypothetical protein n=1 Tax=Streptantibioticus parmotrematis TaxID=2873249 RepID=UPI0033F27BE8